jgi:hypothetical protein
MGKDVFLIRRQCEFALIPKYPLQEMRDMSLAAKGLLSLLLSFPADWEIYMTDVVSRSKNGRESTRTALRELIEKKYVMRVYERDNHGQILGSKYVVSDKPMKPDN